MIKKFNCFHSIIFVRLYSSLHFDDYNTKCIITIIIRLIYFEYFCLFSCKTIQFHRHKYTLLSVVFFSCMLKIFISLPHTFTFLILLFFYQIFLCHKRWNFYTSNVYLYSYHNIKVTITNSVIHI